MSCKRPAWKATSWSSASSPISRASAWAVSATRSSKGAFDSVGFSFLTNSRRLSWVLWRSRRNSFKRSNARTRTCRSRIGTGLTIKSSAPDSTIFIRSGRGSNPVIISTGISAVAGSDFRRLQASCPFITGISTSIRIRSGFNRLAERIASSPLVAASVQKPSVESWPQRRSRLALLSSVTRIVRRSGMGPVGSGSTAVRRRNGYLPSLQGGVKRRVTQPAIPLALKLPSLLSVEEVAVAIHRHPEVVRRQARDGRLPAEKIGRVWFFRPERLAEAGFDQFLPHIASDGTGPDSSSGTAADGLLRALGEAGLEALQHPERNAIFSTVAGRLAEAGLSTYFFLMAPDHKGLTVVFCDAVEAAAEVDKLTAGQQVGTYLPFDRVPVLHRACTTLRPQYIGDHDELVGRVAMVMRPSEAANARRLSELLHLNTAISAPLVAGDRAIGAITVIGPGLRQADLPAVMAFANQTAAALEAARLLEESRQLDEATVLTLAGAIELREVLHSRASEHAALAERFAEHLGFDPARRRRVRYASLLQDLGKLSLPDSLLSKRGRLDAEERALMMTHPGVAADLL